MSLTTLLTSIFSEAFVRQGADASLGTVVVSRKPEVAQFQCNGAMAAAKALGKNPREIAEAVVADLSDRTEFEELSVAGPGFVNIRLADAFIAEHTRATAADDRFGIPRVPEPRTLVVDYGGPNVAKPMHVGHLRSSIIGDSIIRILRFAGHDVKGDIHMGDWGLQMGMVIVETERRMPGLPYFDPRFAGEYPAGSPVTMDDLQEMYPAISRECKEDTGLLARCQKATVELQTGRRGYVALWRHFVAVSMEAMKADFHRLGVDFDLWFGESSYEAAIPPMVERIRAEGHARLDDGAWIVDVAREDDNKPMPPVMLINSQGGTGYHTTDLATIEQRVGAFSADGILYVVDKRQSLHFEQVFRAARKTGIAPERVALEHLPFGTMNGKDGKPFKTRAGGVMRLNELIAMMTEEAGKRMLEAGVAQDYPDAERREIAEKVGMAALRYADLMNVRSADYVFDVERFTQFEGRTGAYLLYAAVRIKSILRKAADAGLAAGDIAEPATASERDLMLKLSAMPDALGDAVRERMPHHVCGYAFDLGQAFSRFYNDCHIMSEPDGARQASWLGLCDLVLREMEFLLGLLGIETPERM